MFTFKFQLSGVQFLFQACYYTCMRTRWIPGLLSSSPLPPIIRPEDKASVHPDIQDVKMAGQLIFPHSSTCMYFNL